MELKQIIKMYLDCMARQDQEFAIDYANKDKNLDECVVYIYKVMYDKAQELAKQGKKQSVCLAPTDDEVFSLAIRYYMDKDLKVEGDCFSNAKILSMSATSFTDEEKQKMRADAINEYKQSVINEQKKKAEKPKKPSNPVLVPDVKEEKKEEKKPQAQQLSLF